MNELVITNYRNSIISAVYENKQMTQVLACHRKSVASVGNIYVGRIDNIVKNINAAFVNISDKVSCYLDLKGAENAVFIKRQSERKLCIGDELIVQVLKEDVKTKAPVVTTNFSITGKYVVIMHHGTGIQVSKKIQKKSDRNTLKEVLSPFVEEGIGLIARTNANVATKGELEAEVIALKEEYHQLCTFGVHQVKYTLLRQELPTYLMQLRDSAEGYIEKVVTNIPSIYKEFCAFLEKYPRKKSSGSLLVPELLQDANELVIRYRINHFMDKALHRTIYLKSGASVVIDPTEAMTVIDVNTGKAIVGKKPSEETFFSINMEAAKEIVEQIRLRNISGIIIIDFINMADSCKKEELKEALSQMFRYDSVQTEVVDYTKLGLMEITRKKVYKTLAEQLSE